MSFSRLFHCNGWSKRSWSGRFCVSQIHPSLFALPEKCIGIISKFFFLIFLKMFDRAFGARIFKKVHKKSIKNSCVFGARILSNYSDRYCHYIPVRDLSMPFTILVQPDYGLLKSDLSLIYGSYFWIYISGRTVKIAHFLKRSAPMGARCCLAECIPGPRPQGGPVMNSGLYLIFCLNCLMKSDCLH